jgi:hypothetical protein
VEGVHGWEERVHVGEECMGGEEWHMRGENVGRGGDWTSEERAGGCRGREHAWEDERAM